MKVLVACEFSGIVREAFKAKGHDAWSCDLLPTEIPGQHIQGDVLEILDQGWDLMIAHPECTRLCNSGVRWLHERNLWGDMDEAAKFFLKLKNANIPKIALENPIPHKYALAIIGEKYTQIIHPSQFGHAESKATCLWLKNLQKLKPTKIITEGIIHRVHLEPPGPERHKNRSRSLLGIGSAMANQWG